MSSDLASILRCVLRKLGYRKAPAASNSVSEYWRAPPPNMRNRSGVSLHYAIPGNTSAFVHASVQQFYASLDDEQRARFCAAYICCKAELRSIADGTIMTL